jgi:NADH:ubiquinone oxidoreductase subunit C
MSRMPQNILAQLRAVAPKGLEYSAQTDAYGVTVAWAGLACSDELIDVAAILHALGARLSMITASQPPAPEEEEEEDEDGDEAEAANDADVAAAETKPAGPPMTFGGTPRDGTSYELAYHFDLGGDTLTLIVYVPAAGSVASLTRLFRTADWPERELMECYAIQVNDHPDPRRLFIDPSIDPAVLERLIPFSTLVNAASTKGLWEKVMTAKSTGA